MKPRNEAGPHRPGPSGEPMGADELLPIRALHERLGWGPRTVARAQKDGLRVIRYAKWAHVLGSDLIDFLNRQQPGDGGGVVRITEGGAPDNVSGAP